MGLTRSEILGTYRWSRCGGVLRADEISATLLDCMPTADPIQLSSDDKIDEIASRLVAAARKNRKLLPTSKPDGLTASPEPASQPAASSP